MTEQSDAFEQVIARARNPIGANEVELRQALGDERYELVQAHNDLVADANLEQIHTTTRALEALATMRLFYGLGAAFVGLAAILGAMALLAWATR